ncbi:MAG: vitamin K epoxide reductase family protein [Acidobacteriota bacterium]
MSQAQKGPWIALAVFATAGVIFAGISTADFIAHLDRQVHAITCSYIPGLGAADTTGSSGCHAILMSPYSAVLRSATWGGIPISLPALAVFAFLLFRAVDLLARGLTVDPTEVRFVIAASLLPVLASVGYLAVSVFILHAICKLCIGIYVSSLGVLASALVAGRAVSRAGAPPAAGVPWGRWALYFAEGVAFVVVPLALYLTIKPAYAAPAGACGELLHPEDRYGVRLKLASAPAGVPAIELLDPLCPACKNMSLRLAAGGFDQRLALEALLFPLDKECNWMVHDSLHLGACLASEAVLCAGADVDVVLRWVFDHQEELRELGRAGGDGLRRAIVRQFPRLSSCLGSPAVRSRLNRSLRWAVANSAPVLTPQLYVRGEKICDEDTDLGLEYVLSRRLAGTGGR